MKRMTVALVLFASGASLAQQQDDEPNFMALDANADGRLSQAEAEADTRIAERFAEGDVNRDGYLSIDEFAALSS